MTLVKKTETAAEQDRETIKGAKHPTLVSVQKTISTMFESEQVVELRCIHSETKMALSGCYDDFERLAVEAATAESEGFHCFVGVNPRRPDKCPVTNKLRRGKTATNDCVAKRTWLFVDIDAARTGNAGGQDESSTNAEKEAARAVLDHVLLVLCEHHGWPRPMVCDSGNGFHALFRIDLPADDKGLIRKVLLAVNRLGFGGAKIDTTVHDAVRLTRCYGTMNRKGTATPDRPHRATSILDYGNNEVLSRTKMQKFACLANKGTQKSLHEAKSQAKDWLMNRPLKAIEGSSDKEPFIIACKLMVDFGLERNDAAKLLNEQNEKGESHGLPRRSSETLQNALDFATEKAASNPEKVGAAVELPSEDEKRPQVDMLVELIREQYLWKTKDDEAYATIEQDGVFKNYAIPSKGYSRWLGAAFLDRYDRSASGRAKAEAIESAEDWALYAGGEHEVFVRVGRADGKFYLDLANDKWEAVEIDADGWRIVTDPPAKFRRATGMRPLPNPVPGGSIRDLREFINVSSEEDFKLIVAWLVMTLNPTRGFPLIVLGGQQGSSKSTTAEFLSSLIDPHRVESTSAPSSEQDLAILAASRRVLVLDNLSYVKNDLSDSLCRFATGGAFISRKLYTDSELSILDFCGPAILNGIVDLARRPDLLERSIVIDLPRLEEGKRAVLSEIQAAFCEAHPRILGALLDAVSFGIANPCKIQNLPRMAEFANFVASVEPEFCTQWNNFLNAPDDSVWEVGDFMAAYSQNLKTTEQSAIENSPLAQTVIEFAQQRKSWQGAPTEFFNELKLIRERLSLTNDRSWPTGANTLWKNLQRILPGLLKQGVFIENKKSGTRFYTVELVSQREKKIQIDDWVDSALPKPE